MTILLSSCANTKFTKQWIDEDFNEEPYDDILVLVVADKMGNRQDAENYIVQKLDEAGVNAIQSYDILPKTETIDADAVDKAIDGLQLDSVIVMYATGVTEEEYFIPTRRFGVYSGYGYGHAHYGSWVKADRSSNVPARECFHGTGAATPGARNGKALAERAIGRLNGQSIVNSCHAEKK